MSITTKIHALHLGLMNGGRESSCERRDNPRLFIGTAIRPVGRGRLWVYVDNRGPREAFWCKLAATAKLRDTTVLPTPPFSATTAIMYTYTPYRVYLKYSACHLHWEALLAGPVIAHPSFASGAAVSGMRPACVVLWLSF